MRTKITALSEEALDDQIEMLKEKIKLRTQNEFLQNHLWELVHAVGRLLDDKYTEGDEAVRKHLWTAMHHTGDKAREYLQLIDSKSINH